MRLEERGGRLRVFYPLGLCLLISAAARGADWPQWLGPTRNGVSSESVSAWDASPPVLWKQDIGSGFSTPVVAGGRLFVHAGVADRDEEEVRAIDAVTGDVVWRDVYSRAPYHSDLGSGPRATPSVAAGRLYTMGITGILSCYDAASGERQWQFNPYDEFHVPRPGFGVCTSPIVAEGRVIMPVGGTGCGIVACDAETGALAWKILDEPAGAASPVQLVAEPGSKVSPAVVVQTTLRLVAVNPQDGAIPWEHPLVFQPSGISPTPLSTANRLICSTQETGTLSLELPDVSRTSPRLEWWKQEMSSYFSSGTVDDNGHVFLVTNALAPLPRADLLCIDTNTGDRLWERQGLGYFHLGIIRTSDGRLLVLDDAGNLSLQEPDEEGLKQLCRSHVCGGTFVNPVLADGRVYVRDRQHITCIDLSPRTEATRPDPDTD